MKTKKPVPSKAEIAEVLRGIADEFRASAVKLRDFGDVELADAALRVARRYEVRAERIMA